VSTVDPTLGFVLKAVPIGFVAMWASIGVVAAVILVRLRDGDFGLRVGAGLFAIGGAAVILMCSQLRRSQTEAVPGARGLARDTVRAMAKSPCPVSKTEFLEKAEAVKIVIGNSELVADKREFSTGSFGWYHNGKVTITVDGKPLSVQCGINLTVVGSKEAER
jgi:hypothetical protein